MFVNRRGHSGAASASGPAPGTAAEGGRDAYKAASSGAAQQAGACLATPTRLLCTNGIPDRLSSPPMKTGPDVAMAGIRMRAEAKARDGFQLEGLLVRNRGLWPVSPSYRNPNSKAVNTNGLGTVS